MREKPFVRSVKAFKKFLNCLGSESASGYPFLKMRFQPVNMYITFVQFVIPFLQGKSVIPYECSLSQHLVEIPVPCGIVYIIFVCNHY